MMWDFPEVNPFAGAAGDFAETCDSMSKCIALTQALTTGFVVQKNATALDQSLDNVVVSTDPPYYDNIGYADLSDFFYVWLRRSLSSIYPDLFSTILVPKSAELVTNPYPFGGSKKKAQEIIETVLGLA